MSREISDVSHYYVEHRMRMEFVWGKTIISREIHSG
jgi:hypothetical protein